MPLGLYQPPYQWAETLAFSDPFLLYLYENGGFWRDVLDDFARKGVMVGEA